MTYAFLNSDISNDLSALMRPWQGFKGREGKGEEEEGERKGQEARSVRRQLIFGCAAPGIRP